MQIVLRIAITTGVVYVAMLPVYVLRLFNSSLDIDVKDDPQTQAYFICLLRYLIPCFIIGFLPFAGVRFLVHKLKLDNEAAIGHAFMTREKYVQS